MGANFIDANTNPHREVKKIISALYIEGSLVGFRIETAKGETGDIEIAKIDIEIPEAMKKLNQWNLTLSGGLWKTDREIITGEVIPDLSENKILVRSLQHHILFLERAYRQENVSGVWEVCFQYRDPKNQAVKWISGYVQASSSDEAAGYCKSYLAQTAGLDYFGIACSYCEPYYEKVDWGRLSPLLAIKLTLASKHNKAIVPKAKRNLAQAKREREERDRRDTAY